MKKDFSFINKTVFACDELPSRLIYVLTRRNVKIYRLFFKGKESVVTVLSKDVKNVEQLSLEYKFSFKILNEYGLLHSFLKILSNWGVTAGIVIGAIFLALSSLFTVRSQINVNDKAVSDIVYKYYNGGAQIIKGDDINKIKAELERSDGVSFANVYKDGMALKTEIYKELDKGVIQSAEESDILSGYDAIVTRIVCLSGSTAVEKDATVKKGETLIFAKEDINGANVTVPALGKVYGRVFYYDVCVYEKTVVVDNYTGNVFNYTRIEPLLPLGKTFDVKDVAPYKEYTVQIQETILNCILPFKIKRYIIKEVKSSYQRQNIVDKLDALILLSKQKCLSGIDDEYVLNDVKTKITEQDDRFIIETCVEVERRIDIK